MRRLPRLSGNCTTTGDYGGPFGRVSLRQSNQNMYAFLQDAPVMLLTTVKGPLCDRGPVG